MIDTSHPIGNIHIIQGRLRVPYHGHKHMTIYAAEVKNSEGNDDIIYYWTEIGQIPTNINDIHSWLDCPNVPVDMLKDHILSERLLYTFGKNFEWHIKDCKTTLDKLLTYLNLVLSPQVDFHLVRTFKPVSMAGLPRKDQRIKRKLFQT